jgi:hypothetical protein
MLVCWLHFGVEQVFELLSSSDLQDLQQASASALDEPWKLHPKASCNHCCLEQGEELQVLVDLLELVDQVELVARADQAWEVAGQQEQGKREECFLLEIFRKLSQMFLSS